MRNRGLVIALVLAALASVNAGAAGKIETCSPDQTLVFSNGVWNTELDWQAALGRTAKFYKKQRLTFKQGVNFSHPSEKEGTPFRMPADTTGSTHYYQSTLEWRKQHKGATLSFY